MAKDTKEVLESRLIAANYELDAAKEKLYSAGIEKRPTLMTKIEEREKELLEHIIFCIKDCEKETGRNVRGQNCNLKNYIKNI